MSEWQAIESAPLDGTKVRVKYPVNFGTYDAEMVAWFISDSDLEGWMTDYGSVSPTHWKPITPPTAEHNKPAE